MVCSLSGGFSVLIVTEVWDISITERVTVGFVRPACVN